MTVSLPEWLCWLFTAFTGLILIVGTGIGLYYGLLYQTRVLVPTLKACQSLYRRPFTATHVFLVLCTTLLLTLPSLFSEPAVAPQKESAVILGNVLYGMAGFLTVAFCLLHSRCSFPDAFSTPNCSLRAAVKKGFVWGVIAIPPIILISMGMAAGIEALGYDSSVQDIFGWLGNESFSPATRLFVMFSAVVIAPVTEEFLFRGVLFPALLKERSFASAVLISGLYFALMHFHAASLLPLLALSVAFSAAYAATGSLLTPIVMHAVFNTTSLLLFLAAEE